EAEVLLLHNACSIGSARNKRQPRAWLDSESADPARPGVVAGRRLHEFGRSPELPVVHAELDGADARAVGDTSNVVFAGIKNGTWRRQVDTRHRFHGRILAPIALAIPVDELTSHGPQADNPFG